MAPRVVSGPEITGLVTNQQTGTPIGGATVTVSATVYTDPDFTSGTTTLTADGTGVFFCYASRGTYTFTTTAVGAGPIESVTVRGGGGPSSGASTVPWEPEVIVRSGTAVVANNTVAPGIRAPRAVTVSSIVVRVGTAPTGSGLTVRINKNGVTWQTITVAATATSQTASPAAAISLGDVFTFDITAVGSTIAGSDVAVAMVAA